MPNITGNITTHRTISGSTESVTAVNGEINQNTIDEPSIQDKDVRGRVTAKQEISGNAVKSSGIDGLINKNVKSDDYNALYNKPSVENIVLVGNKTLEQLGIERFLYGTVEYWNSYPSLVSKQGTIYIYTDYKESDDKLVPGFKVGDGTSYLIDMPFVDVIYDDHINDQVRHITQEERLKWNDKVSVSISAMDEENLVFTNG